MSDHLPERLYVGVQNDAVFLLDQRPCVSGDCPPHADGPNVVATINGNTKWHAELAHALVSCYNAAQPAGGTS